MDGHVFTTVELGAYLEWSWLRAAGNELGTVARTQHFQEFHTLMRSGLPRWTAEPPPREGSFASAATILTLNTMPGLSSGTDCSVRQSRLVSRRPGPSKSSGQSVSWRTTSIGIRRIQRPGCSPTGFETRCSRWLCSIVESAFFGPSVSARNSPISQIAAPHWSLRFKTGRAAMEALPVGVGDSTSGSWGWPTAMHGSASDLATIFSPWMERLPFRQLS